MQQPPTTWQTIERRKRMMGTHVSVHLAVSLDAIGRAEAAIDATFVWLDEVAARLTRFDPTSELWELQRAAGRWFQASPILYDCTSQALAAAERTAGIFDPTLLRHLELAGYDQDFPAIAHRDLGAMTIDLPPTGAWRAIQLDPARRAIWLPLQTGLDLGGIAKGWAADYVIDHQLADFPNAIINLGGDMRLRGGPQPGTRWTVAIDNPFLPDPNEVAEASGAAMPDDYLAVLTPGDIGLATSGANRRWWLRDGHPQHHLIDPRTGRPAEVWTPPEIQRDAHHASILIATATALAETAAAAEVAAKVALLTGYPLALQTVEDAWDKSKQVNDGDTADDAGDTATTHAQDDLTALLLILGSGELYASLNLDAWLRQHSVEEHIWYLRH